MDEIDCRQGNGQPRRDVLPNCRQHRGDPLFDPTNWGYNAIIENESCACHNSSANLVRGKGAEVGQGCHVRECENGPAPAIGLPSDDSQGSCTLGAQRIKDHQ